MVNKLLQLLFILTVSLSSNEFCKKLFSQQLHVLPSGYPTWILDDKLSIFFSPDRPEIDFNKSNPMLGLYLVEHNLTVKAKKGRTKKKEKRPIIVRPIKSKSRFAMDDETYIKGTVKREQVGLKFALFSEPVVDNLVITGGCCTIAGLTIGGEEFIEIDYIIDFLHSDQDYYSDIGARFIDDKNGSIFVNRVNPFFKDNPFKVGDKILEVDGHKPSNLKQFVKDILTSPQDRKMRFLVERNGQKIELFVTTKVLLGGGLLSDTFLENLGIWLDSEFYVSNIHKKSSFAKRGLQNSYKLLSINNETFDSLEDIQKYVSDNSENMPNSFKFLFEHNSFQFFINLDQKDKGDGKDGNSTKFDINELNKRGQGDPWNIGKNSKYDDIDKTYYDIYNKIPLGEYLSL